MWHKMTNNNKLLQNDRYKSLKDSLVYFFEVVSWANVKNSKIADFVWKSIF